MKFCEACGFLLATITKTGELKFICNKCQQEYKSDPSDSLMYSVGGKSSENNLDSQLPKIVKNIPHISSIPKVIKYCDNCKKDKIVSFVRNKGDMICTFVCDCGKYWR